MTRGRIKINQPRSAGGIQPWSACLLQALRGFGFPVSPEVSVARGVQGLLDYYAENDFPKAKLRGFWSLADRRRSLIGWRRIAVGGADPDE